MISRRWLSVGFGLVLCVTAGASTPGEEVVAAALSACTALHSQRALREEAAEAAGLRFVKGGTLWVAGSIPRFDIEWLGRAGGIMPVKGMQKPADVGAADVLVYGCLAGAETADRALLREVRERQALVVAIGPAESAEALGGAAQFYLAVTLPATTPLRSQVAASGSLAALWAFSADLVGSCTRRGVMPTMWQSVMVSGSRERNARYQALRVHTDMNVPPQAAGVLGERYLDAVGTALAGLRTQQAAIRQAGGMLRDTVRRQHKVFHANLGHFEPAALLPADFAIPLTPVADKDPEVDVAQRGAAGDALFVVWYSNEPTAMLKAARAHSLKSCCILAANPVETREPGLADILVDSQWALGDAAVELPGYDVRILPPSGVLNSVIFFAILAEAQAAP
jgi:hypothetical protein